MIDVPELEALKAAARKWGDMANGDIEAKWHDAFRSDLCAAAIAFNDAELLAIFKAATGEAA